MNTFRRLCAATGVLLGAASGCGSDSDQKASTPGEVDAGAVVTAEPLRLALAPGQNDRLLTVVMAPDGRAYAAGYVTVDKDQAMAVVRLLRDGTLDTSFGEQGVAKLNVAPGTDKEAARGLALQDDGKVVISGPFEHDRSAAGTAALDTDVALVRFDVDGKLDSSFGEGGVRKVDLGTGVASTDASGAPTLTGGDTAWGLQALADGRLLMVAATRNPGEGRSDLDLAVLALTQDGVLDTSFAAEGVLRIDVDGGQDSPRQSVQLADGSVVVSGYTQKDGVTQPLLAKLDGKGKLDSAFGLSGLVHPTVLANVAEAYDVALQGDKFVTVGYGKDLAGDTVDLISSRFAADGQLDSSYGKAGLLRIDVAMQDDRGRDFALLPDGRLIFAGSGKTSGTNSDAMLVVASADGTVDATVGDAGKRLFDLGGPSDSFYSVAVSPDQKSVLAVGYYGGDAKNGEDDAVVLRLPISAL